MPETRFIASPDDLRKLLGILLDEHGYRFRPTDGAVGEVPDDITSVADLEALALGEDPHGNGWAITLAVMLLTISRQATPQFIMRMMRAQPIPRHQAPNLYNLTYQLAQRAKLPKPPQLYYINSP